MRNRIFIVCLVLFLILMLAASAGLALAEAAPFHPGQSLFGLQLWSEQSLATLNPDPANRAAFMLDLVQRRIADLRLATGSPAEIIALTRLDSSLDEAARGLSVIPQQNATILRERAYSLLNDLQIVLAGLTFAPRQAADNFGHVQLKSTSFLIVLSDPTQPLSALLTQLDPLAEAAAARPASTATTGPVPTATSAPPVIVNPHIVVFQSGSGGAEHRFWPLTGKHLEINCQACHTQGIYAGTPNQCAGCHLQDAPALRHPFPTTCDLCHNTQVWKQVSFSHSVMVTTDCKSCHFSDAPVNHYPGQCSACHSTAAWKPASFNHAVAGATDCLSCHIPNRPEGHWQGQCSACHSTNGWLPAHFDHAAANATNCQGCHNPPGGHWQGQCSLCHNTNAWKPANFNHAAVGATNCQSCHTPPSGHFSGQCSLCHNTNAWKPANFNHAAVGATNCQSCHTPPSGHWQGQCSLCHNTGSWKSVNFNHAAVGATNCQSCHTPPSNHFPGQCSDCHNTGSWAGATFNHSFPLNHGGANGDCAKCHPSGNGPSYTCFNCHNQSQMDQKHTAVQGYSPACADCHPNGGGN